MYTVRVSQTDPSAYPSPRAAMEDMRLRDLTEGIYLHVEPGVYVEQVMLSYPGPLMIVPTHGPGTVELVMVGEQDLLVARGHRELYGITLRVESELRAPVKTEGAGGLKAVDCRFIGSEPLRVWGSGKSEFVNCRFEGTGLEWRGGRGLIAGCVFDRARLSLTEDAVVVARSIRFSGFEGGGVGASPLSISGSRAEITECVITDCHVAYSRGGPGGEAVVVSQGSQVSFVDLSVSGDRCNAIHVQGKNTRAVFDRLRVEGGFEGRYTVFVRWSAKVRLADTWISHVHGGGVKVVDAELDVDGLTVENTKGEALDVVEGDLRGRGLTLSRAEMDLIKVVASRVRLSDVEFRDHTGVEQVGEDGKTYPRYGAVYVEDGDVELEDVRAFDLDGWLLNVTDGRARMSSVTAERLANVAVVKKGAMVHLKDVKSLEGRKNQLIVLSAGFLETSDCVFEGSAHALACADAAGITLRSTVLRRAKSAGLLLTGGASALLEDSEVRDCSRDGIHLEDEKSRVSLVRCTIADNGGYGVIGPSGAEVKSEDGVFSGNRGHGTDGF